MVHKNNLNSKKLYIIYLHCLITGRYWLDKDYTRRNPIIWTNIGYRSASGIGDTLADRSSSSH